MSFGRIGGKSISVPTAVAIVEIGAELKVDYKGEIYNYALPTVMKVCYDSEKSMLYLDLSERATNVKNISSIFGLHLSNMSNLISGLVNPFIINLDMKGVGYKASVSSDYLNLSLGYSHPIKYKIPNDIEILCPKPTEIVLKSVSKCKIGAVASDLCKIRKYDPYKGKGVFIRGKFRISKEANKK